jgi:DNA-binding HxlR family transcriptional regulator
MDHLGIVTRIILDDTSSVGYTLTPAGASLLEAAAGLGAWLDAHRHELDLADSAPVHPDSRGWHFV